MTSITRSHRSVAEKKGPENYDKVDDLTSCSFLFISQLGAVVPISDGRRVSVEPKEK